ncbi:S-layer homology domain-containing protein [Planococcus lenghuensis]|uniref:SLH domain-containing protein n=1 Tax=Planococcus lenghuensis TaxID=2213202 RepID=A0A1Q2L1A8_9BACL|nr:S-layer homology domain-containing protein [Planococcus lenghuensis]AQQ54240.1 hypothetical protein B0X71_14805 [Planococcus lenghuensis]
MKKTVTSLLSVGLIVSASSGVQASTDLEQNHPFYDEASYLINAGVIKGFPDGSIRLSNQVTREQTAIMLGRLLELPTTQATSGFKDVAAGSEASPYIAQLEEAGVINGFPDGTFRPKSVLTRGQMALVLDRAFDLQSAIPSAFADTQTTAELSEAVSSLEANLVTNGYPDGTFRPKTEITRGQFSAFLARTVEPGFKNEVRASNPNTFLRDLSKTYTYSYDGELVSETFAFSEPFSVDEPVGFAWISEFADGSIFPYYEHETKAGLAHSDPYDDSYLVIKYPVKAGSSFTYTYWDVDYTGTYTNTDVQVTTPYGTFDHAVEVTEDGIKYYYVKGFGLVKEVDTDGTVYSELVSIEESVN